MIEWISRSSFAYILDDIDVLIDGPFVKSLYRHNLKFRGSLNQRIHDLSKNAHLSNELEGVHCIYYYFLLADIISIIGLLSSSFISGLDSSMSLLGSGSSMPLITKLLSISTLK
ncbi:hypothetical protein BFS34_009840 [Macrococcoides caseolyticum subsp. hominis]|nr:hypothetical protein BFS34_009840 [Macrococcus caseolyticus subsp. hominis]